MKFNLDQLKVIHELQVYFPNHGKNDFDFIENFVGIDWSKYFNLEQETTLDVLVKIFLRFANANKEVQC